MAEILPISLSSTLLDDGNYFNYYNGDDLDLDCGIYYLTVDIGGEIWYSDLFHITDFSSQSTVPEIKYKKFHLALPIYDSIYKQHRYRCEGCCDEMLINPMLSITPFFTDEVTFTYDAEVHVYIVSVVTGTEVEITAELDLDYGTSQDYLYTAGGTFVEPIGCGTYYLHFHTDSGDWYSETFVVKNIEDLDLTEYTYYLITEDTEIDVITEDTEIDIIIE